MQAVTVSLGWIPVTAWRAGMAQGDPAGQLALRQRVTDLLEVFAQLVLPEGRLNTPGRPPRYEMASILLLQLFYLGMGREWGGVSLNIKHVYKALKPTDDTARVILQSTQQPLENIYSSTGRQTSCCHFVPMSTKDQKSLSVAWVTEFPLVPFSFSLENQFGVFRILEPK